MLKGIPEILSPELLKVLCEMGHSDLLLSQTVTSLLNLWERMPSLSAVTDMVYRKSWMRSSNCFHWILM